jgi:hypothetical protein
MQLLVAGKGDPMVLEGVVGFPVSAPRVARRIEDQLGLFFGEVGAAADGDGGEEQRDAPEAAR